MKNITLFLFAVCLLSVPATACLNYYYTADKDGHLHYQGDEHDVMIGFNTNFNLRRLAENIAAQEQKVSTEKSFMALSDYAVMLMKMGKNDVALTILQSLYAAHPDQYQLAANLGTSYELAGEVDSALKYIRRGMELNPDAHERSEWVHVKVLETKLALRNDPGYLRTHTVLGLTKEREMDSLVGYQVGIQVRERFPFCPGPDPIMASLLEDFADITLNTNSIEDAKTYYNICKYYFGDTSAAMEEKIAASIALIGRHSNVRPDPEPIGKEGDNLRLGPYTYTEMLDDNNPDKFQIDWTKINTDAVALLNMVGLKPVSDKTDTAAVAAAVVHEGSTVPPDEESGSMWWIVIVVIASCSGLIGVLWYRKR